MNKVYKNIGNIFKGFHKAFLRFPLSVLFLIFETILICYMISLNTTPDLIIQKWAFVLMFGAFAGVAVQVGCERFEKLSRMRIVAYGLAILLILGYYLIILPTPSIDYAVGARTAVAVFSMLCIYIWVPSFRKKFDFNSAALVHFMSAFTAGLYSGVLSIGLAAILGTINVLLFKIEDDYYGYMMTIVWVLFATTYYLSLLPNFNSDKEEEQAYAKDKSSYPRLLQILISYIAIPLISVYTVVLIAYFIKIGVTMKWPSGQLGPMILGYSSVGLIIYILASRLEDKFAVLYQRIFPKVLVPIVIVQLISLYIRLNTYGFTESRYYLILFGIFSIIIGILLSVKPIEKNGIIALFAAGFALFSVLPPFDAFTVSRVSQTSRLENMLQEAQVLADGKIIPTDNADMTLRIETTSILNYLSRRNYLDTISWLPTGFNINKDMKNVFGFESAYENNLGNQQFFYASLNMQKPFNIEGYDSLFQASSYRFKESGEVSPGEVTTYDFEVRGKQYKLNIKRVSQKEVEIYVDNAQGEKLVETGLYEFANSRNDVSNLPKESLPAEKMTMNVAGNGCNLRIIFQNINIEYRDNEDITGNYDMFILISIIE